jgi:8-oxo-dGTP pyrophosphatase MutT (NUDIX family)
MSKHKAGLIPYKFDEDGELMMLFMISSDPEYGGPDPQISKGNIDNGESALNAALREAHEELGLPKYNINKIEKLTDGTFNTGEFQYSLTLFIGEVLDVAKFDPHGDETLFTQWLSVSMFEKVGRKIHLPFVKQAAARILKGTKHV